MEILQPGAPRWVLATTNQLLFPHDRVRSGDNGSFGLRWPGQSVVRFGPLSEVEILPADTGQAEHGLHLIDGSLSFFHRGQPGRFNVMTSGGFAGIKGTEFVVQVAASNGVEQTTVSVIDGRVAFANGVGSLELTNGQQAVVAAGQAPARTAGFIAKNLLQWCFYYPGVLDLNDLPLSDGEITILVKSLAAYRAGDLPAALANYPDPPPPDSGAVRLYHAALLLGAGQVPGAEADLSSFAIGDASGKLPRLSEALRTLIAATKREARLAASDPQLPSEFLAASYLEQSRASPNLSLQSALKLAREAVARSPDLGFGWERVAELEFSFGRIEPASEALAHALRLSPRNAQALALQGFLLAAQNKPAEAIAQFDQALAVDSALANAWLGRGLCRIRQGDRVGGRDDLLIAAAMEPQRAALRDYLAKAWSDEGDDHRAMKELQLAHALDPVVSGNSRTVGFSRGFAVIVAQQSTQALAAMNCTLGRKWRELRLDDLVLQSLMVSFLMIMKNEL